MDVCFRQPTTGKRVSTVRRLGELRLPMKPLRIWPALMHLGIREGVKVRVTHRISGVHHTSHRSIFPSNPPGVSFENIKIFQLIIFETHLNLSLSFWLFSCSFEESCYNNYFLEIDSCI